MLRKNNLNSLIHSFNMFGAIAGDIIGSVYEMHNTMTTDFELFTKHSHFTDDSVMTIAVADSLLTGKDYVSNFKEFGRRHPKAGYGGKFKEWLFSEDREPYNSWGNGSAMRVSAIGFAFDTLEQALEEAKRSAEVTHNHPEGIKGAQATAAAVFMARKGSSKKEIKDYIESSFEGYNLGRTIDEIRPVYKFDVSCKGSVPEAMIAFLESTDYEDALRRAISIGGDSDTIACITGGIAHAFYGKVPDEIAQRARLRLTPDLWKVIEEFSIKYGIELNA